MHQGETFGRFDECCVESHIVLDVWHFIACNWDCCNACVGRNSLEDKVQTDCRYAHQCLEDLRSAERIMAGMREIWTSSKST